MKDYSEYKYNRADMAGSNEANGAGGVNGFGVDALRAMAESGDAHAQGLLGSFYLVGKNGVEKDEAQAAKWFLKAAEQGDAKAQCMMGHCYENGWGVAKSDYLSMTWFRKAAKQGVPEALFNMGLCCILGQGCSEDKEAAVDYFRRAAEKGHAGAQRRLGLCYENGWGVRQNAEEAIRCYEKAVEMGDDKAPELLKVLKEKKEQKAAKERTARIQRMKAARNTKRELLALAGAAVSAAVFHWAKTCVVSGAGTGIVVLSLALLVVCTVATVSLAVYSFSGDWTSLSAIIAGIASLVLAHHAKYTDQYPHNEMIFLIAMGLLALVMLIRIVVKKSRPKP